MNLTKIYNCIKTDKQSNASKTVGRIEIKNLTTDKAALFFYGDIVSDTWQSCNWLEDRCPQDIKEFLDQLSDTKEIEIYVNSGGGSVHGGIAIHNQLKRYKGRKIAYIDGIAASISSIIPLACDEVYAYNSSQIMVHKPWSGCVGNADDMRKEAEALDSCQEAIINIYMDHVADGITQEDMINFVNSETWRTGEKITEIFKVNVIQEDQRKAAYPSDFYNKYKRTPNCIENKINEEKERLQIELELMSM